MLHIHQIAFMDLTKDIVRQHLHGFRQRLRKRNFAVYQMDHYDMVQAFNIQDIFQCYGSRFYAFAQNDGLGIVI